MNWTSLLRSLPRDLRETVAGDIEEESAALRARRGRIYAEAWAWCEAARLAAVFRIERFTHRRDVPPIGEELRRRTNISDAIRQDVAFSIRLLRRQPGFTAVALLALALGIGANTAIFGVVDAVLWRPLPFSNADRIVSLAEQRPREGRWFGPVSPADFYDWRSQTTSFAAMAAYEDAFVNMTGSGEPERIRGLLATPGFFDVLGMQPALGRDFRADQETVGRHRSVLLTDAFWRRRFGSDASVVGKTIAFDGNSYEVVGVLPAAFWWPTHPDAIVPLAMDAHDRALRAAHFLEVTARLKPGVAPQQAHEELAVLGQRLAKDFPAENGRHFPNTRPMRAALVGDTRTALLVLLGAVGFVMLIACANVATLLLARAAGRQKELSVRKAVGASRGRMIQQMLTESVMLAVVGGLLGVLIGSWGLAGLRAIVPAQFESLPGIDGLGLDLRILAAAFSLTLITGMVFGAAPAIVASDDRLSAALNEESRGSSGTVRTQRVRSALVIAELALSLVLLTGAALLLVSFARLSNVTPGFRSEQLVIARLQIPSTRYGDHPRTVAFYQELYARLRAVPGVVRVGATSAPPFSGVDARLDLTIERRSDDLASPVRAHPRLVSTEYFYTMGIPLLRGRGFSDMDGAAVKKVVILNDAAVRRYWRGQDPIGQRVSLGAPDDWMEVVGIVGDVKHSGLDVEIEPEAYIPHRQGFTSLGTGFARAMSIVIRTTSDTASTAAALLAVVHGIDPLQPLGIVRSMDDMIAASVAPQRLNLVLVSAFAVVALVLTAAGLYGVMSYLVTQRTREIGVRMALGATRGQVVGLVIRQAGKMTLVGIVCGVVGALLVTRSMTSLLFGISAANPLVYAGVTVLLALVAMAAVAVPSTRATRVDPLIALRDA
jgi:putative ABC transport system permease protein